MNLSGLLFEFGLAVPFAVSLALHNQIFGRPNFHLAACFAAVPLICSFLGSTSGIYLAVAGAITLGAIFIPLVDSALEFQHRRTTRNTANAFFYSAVAYLLFIQLLLLLFGASPRTIILETPEIRLLSTNLHLFGWAFFFLGFLLSFSVMAALDTQLGARFRMSSGEGIDAVALGLNVERYKLISILVISVLIGIASITRALVIPFSVYSTFSTYILCFCAAAMPIGYRISSTVLLLFAIYFFRSVFSALISPSISDALTLSLALVGFALSIALRSVSRGAE